MQKFTVFSIILSMTLLLIMGDLVVHNYLQTEPPEEALQEVVNQTGSTSVLNTLIPVEENSAVEISEDLSAYELPSLPTPMDPVLKEALFAQAGFDAPTLKEAIFSGLLFQFIPFSDQEEAQVIQSHLFNGEEFLSTVYEVDYPTETASFQAYLSLRERANSLQDLGSIYESNTYGDGSFYFNHDTKTKTVHLVIRSGRSIYAFEYAHVHHENMKKVFDLI